MKSYVLFASGALAVGLLVGCDDRQTGSTEPQAAPAGGTIGQDQYDRSIPGGQGSSVGGQSGDSATGGGTTGRGAGTDQQTGPGTTP